MAQAATFLIPMRGSEQVHASPVLRAAVFLIPMRGSEIKAHLEGIPSDGRFLIPMRGSEMQAALGPYLPVVVPDPHEG